MAGLTHQGRVRSDNQDALAGFFLSPAGSLARLLEAGPDPSEAVSAVVGGEGLGLVAVADGMGGPAGGRQASALALATLEEEAGAEAARGHLPTCPEPLLTRMMHEANRRIRRRAAQEPALAGMGTTLTLAALQEGRIQLAQVGDSRAYLLRGGELRQLTRDQSLVQELVDAGRLTAEEARSNPRRNLILQALGSSDEVAPVLSRESLLPGDRLLLCSDGLTGPLADQEIRGILGAEADGARCCRALVQAANEAGGPDNITVVTVDVPGPS